MDKYHVLHIIGQGCFGKVFKGRRRFSGQVVAMKFISKRGKPDKDLVNLRLEIGILQRLDHPNIIRMLDSFETGTDFVVITELAHGELFEIFQDDKCLPLEEVRHIAKQLTAALDYLHSQKIIHRDMKPQNVLIGADDTIKLCDFGFARVMSCHTTVLTSIKGTPLYMAPELVKEKPYDCSADLWSLGVICYELFVGQPPFFTNSLISLIHLIVENPVTYPENMSADFKSFLQGLLQKNPKQRLCWPYLLHHPFLKDSKGSFSTCSTQASPEQRQSPPPAMPPAPAPAPAPGPAPALAAPPPAQSQVQPAALASDGSLGALSKWLPFFSDAVGPGISPSGTRPMEHGPQDEGFAVLCISALAAYADALEEGLLTAEGPAVARQGLLLLLGGEPRPPSHAHPQPMLPLAALVRGLAQLISQASPPPAILQRLLASPSVANQLLRLLRSLSGKNAAGAGGPAWDLLSDLVRLLGLWLRAPLALGLGTLVQDLGGADGLLMQYLQLAPALIHGGITGSLALNAERCARATCVHHLGTAVNSIKCLGVVFTHLSQAHPPLEFAIELFHSLSWLDEEGIVPRSATAAQQQQQQHQVQFREAVLQAADLLVRGVQAVCQCLVQKSLPSSSSERLARAALQAIAALVHPSSAGSDQAAFPWCTANTAGTGIADGAGSGGGSRVARLHAASQGVREVVRFGLRNGLRISAAASGRPALGNDSADTALLALLWELRTTSGGERLDPAALKVLVGLLQLSDEMAQRFAGLPEVADSLLSESSVGPGAALAATEAACAGAAVHNPSAAWPGVGLLLVVLVTSLKVWSELPFCASELAMPPRSPGVLPPLPQWCSFFTIQALCTRLQSAMRARSQGMTEVQPTLCACYGLELAAALYGALLQQQMQTPGAKRDNWHALAHSLTVLENTVDTVLSMVVVGGNGRQCLEDIRRAEGATYGLLARGPLDGVMCIASIHFMVDEGSCRDASMDGTQSLSRRVVRFLTTLDDPQLVLAGLGPRGLMRLLDLLSCFREALVPSPTTLRLCLLLLWPLRSISGLPPSRTAGLPPVEVAFQLAVDLILCIFGPLSQTSGHGASDLHTDFQSSQTVATVLQFVAGLPATSPDTWRGADATWRTLSTCMQLLSTLVLHHHMLAHEFVQNDGLRMVVDRQLLSAELACKESENPKEPSGASVVVDALLVVSQLSRLSKEYYPVLQWMNICGDLRSLLACNSAGVRAKACNAIGNMARHSSAFYDAIQQAGVLPQLTPLCADSDSACRKFASFAVGNCAFHSDVLYQGLAPAIPRLLKLLEDEDEKTRANAAGAIGNLVRNSADLCSVMLREGALQHLYNLIESRWPRVDLRAGSGMAERDSGDAALARFVADSSVKIALFSLGNLAVHRECREELRNSVQIAGLCDGLMQSCQREDMIHKYAQRLLQKLGG